jgi:hypothetical protein
LEAKGVTGKVKNWIREWLTGRKQRVIVGDQSSEESEIDSGVPQGTILGLPLFTVHIDNIDDFVKLIELLKKFADDTKGLKLIVEARDREKLQITLNELCKWAEEWGMTFNVDKCKIMHVGRSNPRYSYSMNGVQLKTVEEETDVGVIVQSNLKPAKQCQVAANKANGVLKTIWRNFYCRDKRVYLNLYKQYVRPHLECSVSAWSPWLQGDKQVLEKVQEKAINAISGMTGLSYMEKCKELDIETLETRRDSQDMIQTFKFLHGVGNINTDQLFMKMNAIDQIGTRLARGKDNLRTQIASTDIRKNSFAVRVVNRWNNLPDEIKTSRTVQEFKRKLKQHMRLVGGQQVNRN